MTATRETVNARKRSGYKLAATIVAAVGSAGLIAANAHFVYVSVISQPDCVPHAKERGGTPGAYRAAKSSC